MLFFFIQTFQIEQIQLVSLKINTLNVLHENEYVLSEIIFNLFVKLVIETINFN